MHNESLPAHEARVLLGAAGGVPSAVSANVTGLARPGSVLVP